MRSDGAVTYRGQQVAFATSVDLSRWLAQRPEAADCFARHAFRFVTGQRDAGAEAAFVALRHEGCRKVLATIYSSTWSLTPSGRTHSFIGGFNDDDFTPPVVVTGVGR